MMRQICLPIAFDAATAHSQRPADHLLEKTRRPWSIHRIIRRLNAQRARHSDLNGDQSQGLHALAAAL